MHVKCDKSTNKMSKRKVEDDDKSIALQASKQKRAKRDIEDINFNGFVIQRRSQKQREEQRFLWFLWEADNPCNYRISLKGPLGGFDWIRFQRDEYAAVMHWHGCECDHCYELGWCPKEEGTWMMTEKDATVQPHYNVRPGMLCTRKRASPSMLYWLHFDRDLTGQDIQQSTHFMPPLVRLIMEYFVEDVPVQLSSEHDLECHVPMQGNRVVTDFIVECK
jgi:hypothetical protein